MSGKKGLISKIGITAFILVFAVLGIEQANGADSSIYHDGWIDLNKNGKMDPYENPKLDIEKRIDDLLKRMTVEEKTCQMATLYGFGAVLTDELPTEQWKNEVWKDGIANIDEQLNGKKCSQYNWPPSKHVWALEQIQRFFIEQTRLGIPVDFSNEGICGLKFQGATSFPAPIGAGSTWNLELIGKIGQITAREAKLAGFSNVYTPIVEVTRDPRWGRTIESYTEDPFLYSKIAVAVVKNVQAEGVASTPKTFAVYSVPKGGRDGACRTDPHETPREVEINLLMPFKAAFMEGKAMGVMSSYNDYDGVPITANKLFLTQKLRKEYGFKGYIVSDSMAVEFLFQKHHVAVDYKDGVRQAVEAGLNVRTSFSKPDVYINPLRELIKEKKVSMKTINERVRDVLRVKYMLGLFDRPYSKNPELGDKIIRCKEHLDVSLEVSRQSIVLLKNDNNTLPLSKKIKSILITGPTADQNDFSYVVGKWNTCINYGPNNGIRECEIEGYAEHAINSLSVVDAIRKKVGSDVEVKYTKGCEIVDPTWPESEILPVEPNDAEKAEIQKAVELAQTVDVVVIVLGETCGQVGESNSRTSLELTGYQNDLAKAIYKTGKPVVVVLINGRPLTINWINKYVPAVVDAWMGGEKMGEAIADVLFGDYNPGGKLAMTFPKTVGQIPMNFPCMPASQAKNKYSNTSIDDVLYPFGYGLSYTKFEYKNLQMSPKTQKPDGVITISVDVKNIGSRKGDEVVQLYMRDQTSSVITYEKQLRGFERITLEPGQTKTVTFKLGPKELQLWNQEGKWVVEPGLFDIMVGSSSEDIRLKDTFEIVG